MKARVLGLASIAALVSLAAAPAANTTWTPWRAAEGVAQAKGVPIAYYFTTTKPTSTGST